MLESLFGNINIERILFFLLVNEKCYPTQLKVRFSCSLSTIQQALQRLEDGGIIVSFLEGRTRIYCFNPRYPFLDRLTQFLEKAYSFLSDTVKEKYYEPIVRKRPRKKGKP
jgi:hypothetical protein